MAQKFRGYVISIHAESRPGLLSFYLKNGYTKMLFNDPENLDTAPPDIAVGKILSKLI